MEELLEHFKKAEKISTEVIQFAKPLIKQDTKILDIAETIENKIRELGGKPAWPVNISINDIAAHYTPEINDTIVLKEGDLVKVDIGVQVNGCPWDRAFTICIGKKSHPLIDASSKALDEALKIMKAGTKVYEISEIVETTVNNLGFNVVRNLSGHGIEQYHQHAHPMIPNSKNTIQDELESGKVYAMEVFTTNGSGVVIESSPTGIFKYHGDKPVRLWEARKILEITKNEFDQLPFCKRWIKTITPLKLDIALRQLIEAGAIETYPPLKEQSNGLVAQTEETVIIG
ncbi:MAG: type II methionyl aminopeptidase [Candidatus Aenigmarchaeota archaeon]|nr:type II methionyl aminopeptidase [Candidatus Aenigmarchaeota archaeon]